MPDFYTVVTDTGLQALGLASTQGESFSLTQAVVGDGNSLAVIPNKGMTTLVNEVWRGDVSGIKVDPEDPNTFIFEFAIPADTGGFTIREVGLLDESGKLFCIGNFPDTEKPVAVNGSVRDLVVRLPLHFENADVVNLVINAAIVLATKQDIADHNEDPQAHRLATTAQTGFVRLATVEEHEAKAVQTVACTPFGVWELLKSLMSNACASTSTLKIATSNAVCQVFNRIEAHKTADDPHGVVAKVKALLSNSITSASTTTFASPKAVKTVNDNLNAHKSATDPHKAQDRVDSKMNGHLGANDPHGVVTKVKALLSSSITNASTTTFATPKAVNEVYKKFTGHLEDTTPHGLPLDEGEAWQVLIKQDDGSIAWGAVTGVPVGELCFSTNNVALPGTVPVNVKQKVRCALYPQLFEWMKGGTHLTDEAAWDAEAAAQDGTCGKYCWDGGEYFILPCYQHHFATANANNPAGSWLPEELKAHSHTMYTGSLIVGDAHGGAAHDHDLRGPDEIRTESTGGSETRPNTSYVLPCIKAFDVAINAAQLDMQVLAQQVAAINENKVDRSEWAKLALVAVGRIDLVPFRPDALPQDFYMCNGEGLLKTSAAGKTLRAMPSSYKSDWGITENSTHIFLPNVFSGSDGYFFRAVNGSTRRVGHKQGDAIRNISGKWEQASSGQSTKGTSSGAISALGLKRGQEAEGASGAFNGFDFNASRVVPTSHENRPKNIGMTPVVYLPAV